MWSAFYLSHNKKTQFSWVHTIIIFTYVYFNLVPLKETQMSCGMSGVNGSFEDIPQCVTGLCSGLWLGQSKRPFFFFFSWNLVEAVVDLHWYLVSLPCCITHFRPSLSWLAAPLTLSCRILKQTWEFLFHSMMKSGPGTRAVKQDQITILPPPYFHHWDEFFLWLVSCVFSASLSTEYSSWTNLLLFN